jgi:hypothetical protein
MLSARKQAQYDVFKDNNPHHAPFSDKTAAPLNLSNVALTTAGASERAARVAERRAQFKAKHGPSTKDDLPVVQKVTEYAENDSDSESVDLLSDSEAEKIALTEENTNGDSNKKPTRSCTDFVADNFDFKYRNLHGVMANDNGAGMVRAAVGGPALWNSRIGCDIM